MKGIIAEINKTHMIVISDKGDFVKQKLRSGCDIGDEIELGAQNLSATKSMTHLYRQLSAAAASILILAVLFSGIYAYCTPSSYVSVDINPSLTLSLNRFDRIIEVQALNADADKLLQSAGRLRNHKLEQAVEDIIQSASKSGYLKSGSENSIMFVVSAKDHGNEDNIIARLDTTSQGELAKLNDKYNVILEKTDIAAYKNAVAKHISPGKLILAEKIKALKPDFKTDDVKELSVQQALGMIKEGNKDKDSNTSKPQKDDKNAPGTPTVVADKEKDKQTQEQGNSTSTASKDNDKDKKTDTAQGKDKQQTDDKAQTAAAQKDQKNEDKEKKSEKDKEQQTADNGKGKDAAAANNPKVDDKTAKPAGNVDSNEKDNKNDSSVDKSGEKDSQQEQDKDKDKEQDKNQDKEQDKGADKEKGSSESKGNGKGK